MTLQVSSTSIEMLRFLNTNQHHCCLTSHTKFFIGFRFLQFLSLKLYSNISNSTTQTSITEDYLINIYGLSPEVALTAAQKVRLSSTARPNSVLDLFHNSGFSKTQITKIISKHPTFLIADTDRFLKPKIDFLQSLGVSGPQLTKLICSDPTLLRGGLKTRLIPSVEYLKSWLGTDDAVRIVFNRSARVLGKDLEKLMGPKIAVLRNMGVPETNIAKLLFYSPRVLMFKIGRFNETVDVVMGMGFDPSMMFIYAIRIMIGMSKKSWESKINLYKELGWSEAEVLLMFRKQPICMAVSEKKIKIAVAFFMNKLKWTVGEICLSSPLLFLSMEKRIIPRCSVLGVLYSKGVLKRLSVKSALQISEKQFLEKYVVGHHETIPEVLEAYEGKISFAGFEDLLRAVENQS